MKINTVTIKNFRSYKAETTFDFKLEKNKNIILIGGENGAGKSSIFEAIKLCLYGPLTYKYKGMVSNYIAKIKNIINEDAYYDKEVSSFIELDINLKENAEENNYQIKREWSFIDSRIFERYIVIENGKTLEDVDASNFYEYFKSKIPPAIFDLSFFDGEKLFDFFEERITGRKLKDTMLTLNNFDVLNDLSKELTLNAKRKNRERKNLKSEIIELEELEEELYQLKSDHKNNKLAIATTVKQNDELAIKMLEKKKEFIRAGGLNKEERERLIREISKYEEERDRINMEIKNFSNDVLPFLMVSKELEKLEKQIYLEQDFLAYEFIKDKLDIDSIQSNLKDNKIKSQDVDAMLEVIYNLIVPSTINKEFKPLHLLSKDQSNKVVSKISSILNIKISKINYFYRVKKLTERIKTNREKLRSSMNEEEEVVYLKSINNQEKKYYESIRTIETFKITNENLEKEIVKLENKIIKLNEKVDLIKKADNIKDISDDIIKMTDELLSTITYKKRKDAVICFNQIFKQIIRKNIFIDYIDIDEDFEINLYVKKKFNAKEIEQMIDNIGINDFEDKVGTKFIEELLGEGVKINSRNLDEKLKEIKNDSSIELSYKIDIMNLSSGEKQIYILCLYWALIKSAGITIPFIVDTPYARIDETHRNAITTKFLPNISQQVIVLSTNTEIEGEVYKDMKKYVSNEFTLHYDETDRSTIVEEGYFKEVI